MVNPNKGSIRVTHEAEEIFATILDNDDPQRIGRVKCAEDNLDPSQVGEENLTWFHIETSASQTGVGSTNHCFMFPGMRVKIRKMHDGTGYIVGTVSTSTGPDAQPGESRYPGNMTPQRA